MPLLYTAALTGMITGALAQTPEPTPPGISPQREADTVRSGVSYLVFMIFIDIV
jgi:hypothetical protein